VQIPLDAGNLTFNDLVEIVSRIENMRISVHNDEATDVDKLNREQYAEAFARLAESCDTPLVIGLYGSWGIGKTSLMKLIERKLNPENSRSVWFDPWQHQFDETPALALLHTMVDTFKMRSEAKKLMTVIAAAFGSIFLKVTTTMNIKDIDAIGQRYEEERFEMREARVRLHEHFRMLIEKAQYYEPAPAQIASAQASTFLTLYRAQVIGRLRRLATRKTVARNSAEVVQSTPSTDNRRRIIFFIDDLDRCSPSTVLNMLETLKLQLNIPGCVYFLGMDRASIEKTLKEHYKDSEFSEDNYLDKIVQLPFSIPPIAPGSIQQFIEPLLTLELKRCKPLLARGLGDNPRHVKRFINSLALNNELAKSLDIKGYDPLILALLLLIQYRSSNLYRIISNDSGLLVRLIEDQENAPEGIYQRHVAPDAKLKSVLLAAKGKFPSKIFGLESYIYLTQAAPVVDSELKFKILGPSVEAAKAIALSGKPEDVDFFMTVLNEEPDFVTVKTIDYALGLVSTASGEERIKHYLFNGTPVQRNYAALYFKRRNMQDLLKEAVAKGVIDKIQAFSR